MRHVLAAREQKDSRLPSCGFHSKLCCTVAAGTRSIHVIYELMHGFRGKSLSAMILGLALSAKAAQTQHHLALHDLKGGTHTLEEYHGNPVVLNFWATWCVPCATEMPLLREMQSRYKGRVIFIAASVDDEDMKPAVEAFIKKHTLGGLNVMMGASLDSLTDFDLAQVMPGTVFIDAEGNIVDRMSGALKRPALAEQLRKMAGEPAPLPAAIKKPAKKTR